MPSVHSVSRLFANPASSGDNLVVAAVAGKRIRVLACAIVATAAVSAHFRSGTTPISATFPVGANGGAVLPESQSGWYETEPGEALNINLSVATATGVQLIVAYV